MSTPAGALQNVSALLALGAKVLEGADYATTLFLIGANPLHRDPWLSRAETCIICLAGLNEVTSGVWLCPQCSEVESTAGGSSLVAGALQARSTASADIFFADQASAASGAAAAIVNSTMVELQYCYAQLPSSPLVPLISLLTTSKPGHPLYDSLELDPFMAYFERHVSLSHVPGLPLPWQIVYAQDGFQLVKYFIVEVILTGFHVKYDVVPVNKKDGTATRCLPAEKLFAGVVSI